MTSTGLIKRETMSESAKWRYITDNTLKMFSFGFLCGGALSMVLFRSVTARAAATAFGAGCGLGKSYVDSKYILGHDISAASVWVARVTPDSITSKNNGTSTPVTNE